jgi:hypothetical protein
MVNIIKKYLSSGYHQVILFAFCDQPGNVGVQLAAGHLPLGMFTWRHVAGIPLSQYFSLSIQLY